jgi:hypothetical protein
MPMRLRALLTAAALLLYAGPAPAQLDRPDIPDVFAVLVDSSSPTDVKAGVMAIFAPYPSTFDHYLGANLIRSVVTTGGGLGVAFIAPYEPDKVLRKVKTQQLKQGDFAAGFFAVAALGTTFSASFTSPVVTGIKGQMKVKDGDGDALYEQGVWKGEIGKAALDTLGLTQLQKDAIKAVFGSPSKIQIKGKFQP